MYSKFIFEYTCQIIYKYKGRVPKKKPGKVWSFANPNPNPPTNNNHKNNNKNIELTEVFLFKVILAMSQMMEVLDMVVKQTIYNFSYTMFDKYDLIKHLNT